MSNIQGFEINKDGKSYIITSNEWLNASSPLLLIRSELRSPEATTLFLLGVDRAALSLKYIGMDSSDIMAKLYQQAVDSIQNFVNEKDWIEGKTYYGELEENELFHITDVKPSWENGSWGQVI